MQNKLWLLLLWGAPAAGKSTLAHNIVTEYARSHGRLPAHIGTDKLNHAVLGEEFEKSFRVCLYECLYTLAEGALRAGRPVIVEGTFLKDEQRRALQDIADKHSVLFLSVQVECRLRLRESRNNRRPDATRVPQSFLFHAHESAKNQIGQAHFVFDTELHNSRRLAKFLLDSSQCSIEKGATKQQGK